MAFSDYSLTASSNTTIGGIDIDENCDPGNINNAIRQLMADAKAFDNSKADGSLYVTKASSSLSTDAIVTGKGGVLHNINSGLASGGVAFAAEGDARPSGAFLVFYYTP